MVPVRRAGERDDRVGRRNVLERIAMQGFFPWETAKLFAPIDVENIVATEVQVRVVQKAVVLVEANDAV